MSNDLADESIKVSSVTLPDSPSGSESFFLTDVTQIDDTTIAGTVENVLAFTGFSWGDRVKATLPVGAQARPYVSSVVSRAERFSILIWAIDGDEQMPDKDDPRSAVVQSALSDVYTKLTAHDDVLAERWMGDLMIVSIPGNDKESMIDLLAEAMDDSAMAMDSQGMKFVFDLICSPEDPVNVELSPPPGYAEEADRTLEITDFDTVQRIVEEYPWQTWIDELVSDGFASKDVEWVGVMEVVVNLLAADPRAVAAVERGDGRSLAVVAVRTASVKAGLPLGSFPAWMSY